MSSMNSSCGDARPLGDPPRDAALAGVVAGQREVRAAELLDEIGEVLRPDAGR